MLISESILTTFSFIKKKDYSIKQIYSNQYQESLIFNLQYDLALQNQIQDDKKYRKMLIKLQTVQKRLGILIWLKKKTSKKYIEHKNFQIKFR
ncbi:unnamed protein product [Paramecium primaurelia]|uniref:Uncharacterized protein n=1 Tax=Paramecium primaurelia TaxID=5886 RepID=A0A8S1N1P5_PARPR|nr:unnamed protein product [Paramecium primaurelia]